MSTAIPEIEAGNPYVTRLRRLMDDKHAALDWLVIAHNDPEMIRRVSEVVSKESAVIRIPQCNWELDGRVVSEVVEWSISDAGIEHLLLVGHSQAGLREECASWVGDGMMSEAGSSPSLDYGLLDGATQIQREIQQSKEHFVGQIDRLGKIEAVQDAIGEGRLQLHALFYLSHSGTFMVFDFVKQTLCPIGG